MDNQLIIPFLEELELEGLNENVDQAISNLLSDWERIKVELEGLYRNRDQKSTLQGMKKGIGLFIQFLYWSNDRQINSKEPISINQLVISPVNLDERLAYILSRPNLFHSYRQLSELMTEQAKQYAKKNIVKKRLSQKG
ncbi:YpoC family protein [Neobacillus drentensis]|uniref:YpoC family protein n=1 Tax=Neobacillus drentensis TaxID=220684 RepID=UPI002FFE85A0